MLLRLALHVGGSEQGCFAPATIRNHQDLKSENVQPWSGSMARKPNSCECAPQEMQKQNSGVCNWKQNSLPALDLV